jgi:hypothetical protein
MATSRAPTRPMSTHCLSGDQGRWLLFCLERNYVMAGAHTLNTETKSFSGFVNLCEGVLALGHDNSTGF